MSGLTDTVLKFVNDMQRIRNDIRTEFKIFMVRDLYESYPDMYLKVRTLRRLHDTEFDDMYANNVKFVTKQHVRIQDAIDDNEYTEVIDENFSNEFRKIHEVTVVMECTEVHPEYF